MPRPLNWIRGEGTTKNQRGLGDDGVSTNEYINWVMGSGDAPMDYTGQIVDANPNANAINLAKATGAGSQNTLLLVAAGVALILLVKK